MITKILLVMLLLIPGASAYELTGEDLIIPRYYEGNLLIRNEGHVSYSIFDSSDDYFVGEITPGQGIYLNETLNYSIYGSYNEVRDLATLEIVEKRFNQWWYIVLIIIIVLIAGVTIYRTIISR